MAEAGEGGPDPALHLAPSNIDGLDLNAPTDHPYAAARRGAAQASIAAALALYGILIIVVSLVDDAVFPSVNAWGVVVSVGFGLVALVFAITFGKRPAHAELAIWTWAVVATLFVASQCIQSLLFREPLDIADPIIVVVVLPPVALSWPAALTSSLVSAALTVSTAAWQSGSRATAAIFTVSSAVAAGWILMYLRTKEIDRATALQMEYQRYATSDPITGVLSWEALTALAPNMASIEQPTEVGMHLAIVTVPGLGSMEDDYGEAYGDRVLRAVTKALEQQRRPGELLARRGPDSFALLGLGPRDEQALQRHLQDLLHADPVSLGKRPISVRVSVQGEGGADAQRVLIAREHDRSTPLLPQR